MGPCKTKMNPSKTNIQIQILEANNKIQIGPMNFTNENKPKLTSITQQKYFIRYKH